MQGLKLRGEINGLSARTQERAVSPSPERIVRFGIIGTGRIAKDFAKDLKHVSGAGCMPFFPEKLKARRHFRRAHGAFTGLCLD